MGATWEKFTLRTLCSIRERVSLPLFNALSDYKAHLEAIVDTSVCSAEIMKALELVYETKACLHCRSVDLEGSQPLQTRPGLGCRL